MSVPVNSAAGVALVDLVNPVNALPSIISLSLPLDNAAPALGERGTLCRTSPWHRKVSSIHACAVSLHGLTNIKTPCTPTPTIVLSPILSESNVSS